MITANIPAYYWQTNESKNYVKTINKCKADHLMNFVYRQLEYCNTFLYFSHTCVIKLIFMLNIKPFVVGGEGAMRKSTLICI